MADFFEEALASIGGAISDVREKVVEEGWFGRSVSDGQAAPEAPDSGVSLVTAPEETAEPATPFDERLNAIINERCDPDFQPHGQVVDR